MITGIDIGTATIRVLVAESQDNVLRPITLVKKPSEGLRHGHIINAAELSRAVRDAVYEAEQNANVKIRNAVVSVGGIALGTETESSTVAISRADGEVTDLDINRVMNETEAKVKEKPNHKIIHNIPIEYKVDHNKIIGNPSGVKGGKFEGKNLFITVTNNHFRKLVQAIESAGVEVDDVFASPVAESIVTVSNVQKNAGCIISNVGAETVTNIVYEEGLPQSVFVLNIGSSDITNDIALGLKVSLEEAEDLKKGIGTSQLTRTMQKQIADIISARLSDIFELINAELKKLGRNGLLPAGVIFTGAGAHIEGIEEVAREQLKLPAKIGKNTATRLIAIPKFSNGESQEDQKQLFRDRQTIEVLQDPEWSVAYGLCVLGIDMDQGESRMSHMAHNVKHKFTRWIQQFLP